MTNDQERLRRHHNATIGLFVAFWIFVPIAIGVVEFTNVSESMRESIIGTLFGAVVVMTLLQFKERCPICHANLGLQWRLGIPRNCHKCGATLR